PPAYLTDHRRKHLGSSRPTGDVPVLNVHSLFHQSMRRGETSLDADPLSPGSVARHAVDYSTGQACVELRPSRASSFPSADPSIGHETGSPEPRPRSGR